MQSSRSFIFRRCQWGARIQLCCYSFLEHVQIKQPPLAPRSSGDPLGRLVAMWILCTKDELIGLNYLIYNAVTDIKM
jgi:hypothetical protein